MPIGSIMATLERCRPTAARKRCASRWWNWSKVSTKAFNDTHLWEKLKKVEGLVLSRQSVQRILRDAKLASPQKRRASNFRSRRERRAQEGTMLQTDGSTHDWLEGRGPKLTMIGFIDDATGKVPVAQLSGSSAE